VGAPTSRSKKAREAGIDLISKKHARVVPDLTWVACWLPAMTELGDGVADNGWRSRSSSPGPRYRRGGKSRCVAGKWSPAQIVEHLAIVSNTTAKS
jgi:hypothetical protein